MKIHSIFTSLQGEGKFQGFPSLFLRFSGCNLNCGYCDAKEAAKSNSFKNLSCEYLTEKVMSSNIYDLCITGGEPFCQQQELENLLNKIKGKRITIETNGSFDVTETGNKFNDLYFSIDWKTPSSGNTVFNRNNLKFLQNGKGWLKFVVSNESDLSFISDHIEEVKDFEIFISPVFENGKEWFNKVCSFAVQHRFLRFQLQLHKILGIE